MTLGLLFTFRKKITLYYEEMIKTDLVEDISGVFNGVQVESMDVVPFVQLAFNIGYGSAQGAQFPGNNMRNYLPIHNEAPAQTVRLVVATKRSYRVWL